MKKRCLSSPLSNSILLILFKVHFLFLFLVVNTKKKGGKKVGVNVHPPLYVLGNIIAFSQSYNYNKPKVNAFHWTLELVGYIGSSWCPHNITRNNDDLPHGNLGLLKWQFTKGLDLLTIFFPVYKLFFFLQIVFSNSWVFL